jgi:hypothetical protein
VSLKNKEIWFKKWIVGKQTYEQIQQNLDIPNPKFGGVKYHKQLIITIKNFKGELNTCFRN